ncbi:MAG: hypothetical protein AAFP88_02440 [Bacteroidota bacterium]
MVSEGGYGRAIYQVFPFFCGGEKGKQLSIKGAVPDLSVRKFPAEES